ncbi:M20/M25/M40 family metallo-hydrolase [Microvirga antarctica]|uniref:M20/M25/M40 family metallo-hydrolase n=1 Tax=Microvirga antarctica TaxID=2819233 RepID=UPI001B317B0B|nr:M20/M25/M40 family metallo-hydrolase [Microvirga antarctica]
MNEHAEILAHIHAHLDEHILGIQRFVRQPSISLDKRDLAACAAVFAEELKAAGCEDAEIVDLGDGYPGVWGSIDCGQPETLLIYGHYDVRPVGTEPWTYGAFDGAIAPFGGFPKTIVGRGAAAKGPLLAFVYAMKAILAVKGTLPVNLMFLIEGAEILGSPNYGRLAETRMDRLQKATALYGPRAGQDASGAVGFTLGYKGLIYFDLVASTAAWERGPQGGAVHSATNAVVDNVAWRLIQAMATMTDPATGAIAIPALLAAVSSPKTIEPWEVPMVEGLRGKLAERDPNGVIPGLSPQSPVRRFRDDLSGADLAETYMYGPSMNVSSLRSGYTGPGTKSFLLPDVARATIDLRVVSETPAAEIVQILRDHLDNAGFPDVAIEAHAAYDWFQTSIESPLVQSAIQTLAEKGHPSLPWAMQAFGGPWAHFGKTLGIPSLQGAAPGHGARAATSDEFFVLEGQGPVVGLAELEAHFVSFLYAYAGMGHAAVARAPESVT